MSLNEQELRSGIAIMSGHVQRLARAAQRLVDSDVGLAFSLWSIGVEEAAKLEALREGLSKPGRDVPDWALGKGRAPQKGVSLHQSKFELGLQALRIPAAAVFPNPVKVRRNTLTNTQTLRNTTPDGRAMNVVVSIPPGFTGEIEDTSNTDTQPAIPSPVLSQKIRFDNLYVDFDADRGWQNPIPGLESNGLAVDIPLSTSFVSKLIERLDNFGAAVP